jgi:hypothetical protein
MSGCRYHVIFVDDFSRYTWLYPLHAKSEVFATFVKFKTLAENQFPFHIKKMQSDGGGEYTSSQFQSFLTQHGIIHRKTCPHTSQQNGVAERKLRHILETGLTMLAHSGLSNKYWVDSFLTAVYIINRLPTPVLHQLSPFEKLFDKVPEYALLKVFGCKCFPLLRPYTANKLEYRSKPCVFLGYSHAGYRCLEPLSGRVFLSRHVVFDEASFPAKDDALSHLPSRINASADALFLVPVSFPFNTSIFDPHTSNILSSAADPVLVNDVSASTPASPSAAPISPPVTIIQPPSSTHLSDLPPSDTASSPVQPTSLLENQPTSPIPIDPAIISEPLPHILPPTTSHPMVTRSRTGSLHPKQYPEFHLYYTSNHPPSNLSTSLTMQEPSCFTKAAIDSRWQDAMAQEFSALISNGTWTLCPRPAHHNIIRNKWVYKIKRKADGSLDRFKARLVAKGFEQQSGIDYTDTFSPVIKPSTIRIVLALAIQFNWPLKQLDVSNAFLHGSLMEEVYMEQPQGFQDSLHPDYVCKLHKAIYGLKQAPRAWFQCLSTSLLELGFIASLVDTSLFIYHHGRVQIFLLVYVDDIIITGSDISVIHLLISKLQHQFPLKDLGSLSFFLGIQAQRSPAGLHLSQTKYITELLHRVKMLGAKPASSPCPCGSKLSGLDGDPLPDPSEYRSVVGALLYCTLTRPELSFAVNQLCQFMHSPTTSHWTAAKRVLRYLKGSLNHGLHFTASSTGSLHLQAFCDSDWAGSPDDRRSTSGYGVYLGNSLVSWSAKKQAVVSRSSTESEYRAMSITTAELFWLRMLFKELGVALPHAPVLWCDNVSALALASNPVFHARTKHIEVDYHFVREKVVNGDILIKFISTHDQIADIFTKGLSTARFNFLKSKLMVVPPPISLRGNVSDLAELESKAAAKSATCTQRVIGIEPKAGAAATCSQDDQQGPYDTDPNYHAITYCTAATLLPKKERKAITDCTAAAPLSKKERKDHDATAHACSSRLHSCSHPEKEDQGHTAAHYADKENHSRASRSDHNRDGTFDLKGIV